MKLIVLALIFAVASLSSQTLIGIHSGMSFRGNDYNRFTEFSPTSWNDGLTFGALVDREIATNISVRAAFEYNHYTFRSFDNQGWPPNTYVGSSRGDNAHCYRVTIEGSYTLHLSPYLSPIFVTGVGYAEERNGAIWYSLVNTIDGTETAYHIPKRFKPFPFHSLGVGIQSFVSPRFGIEIMARNVTNYATRFHQAVNLVFLYRLE